MPPEKLKICKSEGPDEDGHQEGLNMADRSNLGPTRSDRVAGASPGEHRTRISGFHIFGTGGNRGGGRKTENLKTWKKSHHFLKNIKREHNK